jgi:hypothetical protein
VSKPPFRDEYLEAAIEDLIEAQGSYDAFRFGFGILECGHGSG